MVANMKKSFLILILYFILLGCPIFYTQANTQLKGISLGEFSSGCDYYLIEDSYDDYSLVEWYGGTSPDNGDIVYGDLHSYGFKDLYDATNDQTTHVWLDDWMLSQDSASEKLIDKCGWDKNILTYFSGNFSGSYSGQQSQSVSIPSTQCVYPATPTCNYQSLENYCKSQKSQQAAEVAQCIRNGGQYSASGCTPYTEATACNEAVSCANNMSQYNSAQQEYYQCINQQQLQNQNSIQQSNQSSCKQSHGNYSQYDTTLNKCTCISNYWLDPKNSQCELPATVCANTTGPNSHPTDISCVCDDYYRADSPGGVCKSAKKTFQLSKKVFDWIKSGKPCGDPSLTHEESAQCVIYMGNSNALNVEIVDDEQNAKPATQHVTANAPVTPTSQKAINPPAATKALPQQPKKEIPKSKLKNPNAVKEVTAPTIIGNAATNTPTTTPVKMEAEKISKQKHWYDLLNPLSWFK